MRNAASKLKKGQKVLDAGAGPMPYRQMFNQCDYESTDFVDPYHILTFVCRLDKIPRKSNYYDALVSTEVLEHVEYPQKVVSEFHRVLKKGGNYF